jgi:hypothetical protein
MSAAEARAAAFAQFHPPAFLGSPDPCVIMFQEPAGRLADEEIGCDVSDALCAFGSPLLRQGDAADRPNGERKGPATSPTLSITKTMHAVDQLEYSPIGGS